MAFQRAFIIGVALAALAPFAAANARTATVLHSFAGGSDGWFPVSNLIADQAGDLFGTTEIGGGGMCGTHRGCGTVFKLAPDGTETVLYAFRGQSDGKWPMAGLIADQAGNLYGTTSESRGGGGTVFEVTQGGVHTVLYTFQGGSDGYYPVAGLVADQAGNLYGTTAFGGDSCDCGTVFEVTPAGVHTVLYYFQGGSDGGDPQAPLIFDAEGNLYGTTVLGGAVGRHDCLYSGCGTIFKLAPDGTETVLYAFRARYDGSGPDAELIFDAAGNLYGVTAIGGGRGGCFGNGCGTVFKLAPDGTETVLSRFNSSGGPANPQGGLVLDTSGNLFGTSLRGGTAGCGTVYEVAPGRKAKAIHSFTCGRGGADPAAGLLQDQTGHLYGTTESGGSHKKGTVFVIAQ